jgi:hypothetical protein
MERMSASRSGRAERAWFSACARRARSISLLAFRLREKRIPITVLITMAVIAVTMPA